MGDREALPQLSDDRLFLTDGGLETTLIFHQGLDLPAFAAFPLVGHDAGRAALRAYFEPYLAVARDHRVGFVLDTATWRANPDWGEALGYSPEALDEANRSAVALAEDIRAAAAPTPIVVNGVLGPRGDGYRVGEVMDPGEAERYHARQIATLAGAGADMVSAITLTYVEEALGIVRAARAIPAPVAISFTVETDGRLPSGQSLEEAVEQVDAETGGGPDYFMINCAHPTHFAATLGEGEGEGWLDRVKGLRANASTKSHAELDEAEELDAGDPVELAEQYQALRPRLRRLTVLGGCCGTDHRHVAEICGAWLS
jgi:S-methylmethionine-dependent homocysteine/selenocysteine methylase